MSENVVFTCILLKHQFHQTILLKYFFAVNLRHDLFMCEDNMLFSCMKMSFLLVSSDHLVFYWLLYNPPS